MDKPKTVEQAFKDFAEEICKPISPGEVNLLEPIIKVYTRCTRQLLLESLPGRKGRKICFGEDCTSDKRKGYNQALSDVKQVIDKLCGGKDEEINSL